MAEKQKEACKYGIKCYQRNEAHINRFSHPTKTSTDEEAHEQRTFKRETSRSPQPEHSEKRHKISDLYDEHSNQKVSKADQKGESNDTVPIVQQNIVKKLLIEAANSSNEEDEAVDNPPDRSHDINYISKCFDHGSHYSQRSEYEKLLESPAAFIKDKFLVEMPSDFYLFWEFCEAETKNTKTECIFEKFGLMLVGPFDVLAKKFINANLFEPAHYLRHWRFYYDPPEFQVSAFDCILSIVIKTNLINFVLI